MRCLFTQAIKHTHKLVCSVHSISCTVLNYRKIQVGSFQVWHYICCLSHKLVHITGTLTQRHTYTHSFSKTQENTMALAHTERTHHWTHYHWQEAVSLCRKHWTYWAWAKNQQQTSRGNKLQILTTQRAILTLIQSKLTLCSLNLLAFTTHFCELFSTLYSFEHQTISIPKPSHVSGRVFPFFER